MNTAIIGAKLLLLVSMECDQVWQMHDIDKPIDKGVRICGYVEMEGHDKCRFRTDKEELEFHKSRVKHLENKKKCEEVFEKLKELINKEKKKKRLGAGIMLGN